MVVVIETRKQRKEERVRRREGRKNSRAL